VFRKVGGLLTSLLPTFDFPKPTPDQRPTILFDPTVQIILGLRISQSWRTTHLPSSDFRFSETCSKSMTHDIPRSNDCDQYRELKLHDVCSRWFFRFMILIGCHMSFPDERLGLLRLPAPRVFSSYLPDICEHQINDSQLPMI
jgi:hypothetical protein